MNLLPKFNYTNNKFILSLLGIFLAFFIALGSQVQGNEFQPASPISHINQEDLSLVTTYQGLPVGKVEEFNVSNSWGTVIYLPQYHRNPGSSAEDNSNTAGAKSQEQIYQVIKFLIEKSGVGLAMVEGSLFGEVPAEKVGILANKIEKRNQLVLSYEALEKAFEKEPLDPKSEEKLLKDISKEIAKVDREIILEGAAEKLKAEGANFSLFGSENPVTREESKLVLRDYIFLSDRIKQLDQPSSNSTALVNSTTYKQSPYLNSGPNFRFLESSAAASGKDNLVDLLKQTEKVFTDLTKNTSEKIMVQGSSDNPSRKDNPYKDMTDKAYLKGKLSEVKGMMEDVIVNRRNLETAENFAQILKEGNAEMGILQFGAGHEKGLVKELNNQGLNVVVVTVNEVLVRNLQKD